jgi:hypothetical protein
MSCVGKTQSFKIAGNDPRKVVDSLQNQLEDFERRVITPAIRELDGKLADLQGQRDDMSSTFSSVWQMTAIRL